MGPKISVIIPVYNDEKYIKKCLDSIINQTFKNIEVIIIDDGSTDKTLEMCSEYATSDDRIVVIHKENGGVSSARNLGLEKASGELITFVDGDDYIELNTYEKCIGLFEKESVEAVRFNLLNDSNLVPQEIGYTKDGILSKDEIVDLFLRYKLPGSVCAFIIKRDTIKDLRFQIDKHLR